MKLEGKIALVTGASRGIGRATTLALAKEGAKVVINYRSDEKAALELEAEVKKLGQEALLIQADVSVPNDIERMFVMVLKAYGTLDILVNNAGTHIPKSYWELSYEDWNKVLATNVIGSFMCAREAARIMLDRKTGTIINIASVRGLFHCGRVGNMDYSASKAALISMTSTLAKELAPHVRVNAIAPGPTDTDLTRSWDKETMSCAINESYMKRLMKPEEIANAACFLASDDASGMTGATLVVDGGYSLK